jgi:hypothetical protein
MLKVPFIAAAAALAVGLFTITPASATVAGSGPLPILTSSSGIQLAAANGQPRKVIKRGSNHRSNNRWSHNRWHHNGHAWNHRWHHGWGGPSVGFAFGPGIYAPGYGYGAPGYGYGSPVGDDHVQYCMNRYRSYDPNSDTFMGYDGMRHRCNVSY